MKLNLAKGSLSVILTVFIQDSSSTTGAGLGSLDQTSGIVGGYVRMGGLGVALVVDENVTTEGTYQAPSTAAQVRIGTPANMRTGTYELHFHNNLFATGSQALTVTLGGATNMADLAIEVQLGADAVWDEDVEAAHGTDGTAGLLLRVLGSAISNKTHDATLEASIRNIIDVTESGRKHHTHISTGEIFYVDPVNGDTHGNGNRGGLSDPYLTIQDCHDNAVTDSNHDMILLLPGAAAGATTHTVAATTTISKRYVLIRGPGRDFIITRTGSGDTIAITGEGIELEGFQIGTAATGSGNGVSVTADFALLHQLWVNDTQGDGININQSDNCIVNECRFNNTGVGGSGDGLEINGTGTSSNSTIVKDNIFEDVSGDAIKLTGGTITDTLIENNTIHGSSGWGINIATGSHTMVRDNRLGSNTSGDITDSGTDTVQINNEQHAKHSIATEARLAELDAGNLPAVIDAILADTGTDGVVLSASTMAAIADALLDRDMSTGTDSGSTTVRTVRQALRILRNKWSVTGTTMTVTKEDDATASWTSELTSDAAAEPVTGSNPAGGS